jgi:SecY interacting protein Syd
MGDKFVAAYQHNHQQLPSIEFDEQWSSPCQVGDISNDKVQWQPTVCIDELSFDNVEEALELTLHDDIKSYFTALYSESIPANCDEGALELLFAWNKDDFNRLQENLIGHVLMKRRLKQDITLFFAVTNEDDFILSLNNESGEVWVEQVGCQPHKKIANSLAEFIESLSF